MTRRIDKIAWSSCLGGFLLALCVVTIASCTVSNPTPDQPNMDTDLDWPAAQVNWHQTTELEPGWEQGKQLWTPTAYEPVRTPLPGIQGAEVVGVDQFCATCHATFTSAFVDNVHHGVGCEQCHGGASLHLAARGLRPGTILSLRKPPQGTTAGQLLSPAERSEICLRCHDDHSRGEETPRVAGDQWRSSSHAHREAACSDCHRAHYLIPPGTPAADEVTQHQTPPSLASFGTNSQVVPAQSLSPLSGQQILSKREFSRLPPIQPLLAEQPSPPVQQAAFEDSEPPRQLTDDARRAMSRNLGAIAPMVCYECHQSMQRLEEVPHPHQLGARHVINGQTMEFNCTTCHNAHGNVRAETRRDLCLQCHQGPHVQQWSGSPHDVAGVGCTDCHNPHPESGPPMFVNQPETCYRCHSEMEQLEQVAHPHQIMGPNQMLCTTCHEPHGRVDSATREETCLKCHQGAPTMAWHSSSHSREGVACADCHTAHPTTKVSPFVTVSHTAARRSPRLPMSVNEPTVCYGCHTEIFGKVSMPSHHPIREGKMLCSDCHDGHGQNRGNLKADTLNDLCFQCHAEKEGPFTWEHPPVTENCDHCHDPHGTVTNNLLQQPTTFLCLRCHVGHSTHDFDGGSTCLRCHTFTPFSTDVGGGALPNPQPTNPATRQALFTDCTQCHKQIHGTDLTRGFVCGGGMRR